MFDIFCFIVIPPLIFLFYAWFCIIVCGVRNQKSDIKAENYYQLSSVSTINPAGSSESASDQTSYPSVHELNNIDTTSYRSAANSNDANSIQPNLGKFDILFSNQK